MGRRQGTQAGDDSISPPVDKSKQLEQAQADEARHRERAGEFLKQKQEKQRLLTEKNEVIRKSIDEVVGGLPESDSSDLVAKILNLKNPDRAQLIEDVDKLGIAMEAENRLATVARITVKQLEDQIDDDRRDAATTELHALVLKYFESYKICNGLRHRMFEQTGQCDFKDFASRMSRLKLKAAPVVGALCESYLSRPGRLDEMSVSQLAKTVQDLGAAYGVTLLAQGSDRVRGDEDIPSMRENYFQGYGRAEQMKQ